jgi:hypothetical protein
VIADWNTKPHRPAQEIGPIGDLLISVITAKLAHIHFNVSAFPWRNRARVDHEEIDVGLAVADLPN